MTEPFKSPSRNVSPAFASLNRAREILLDMIDGGEECQGSDERVSGVIVWIDQAINEMRTSPSEKEMLAEKVMDIAAKRQKGYAERRHGDILNKECMDEIVQLCLDQARNDIGKPSVVASTATSGWQPIETAPKDKPILLWWRSIDSNPLARDIVIGQVSSHEPGKWWNGQRGEYQDLWHVTEWQPLPASLSSSERK